MKLKPEVQQHIADLLKKGKGTNLVPYEHFATDGLGVDLLQNYTANVIGIGVLGAYPNIAESLVVLSDHNQVLALFKLEPSEYTAFVHACMLLYDTLDDIIDALESGTFAPVFAGMTAGEGDNKSSFAP